MAVHMCQDLCVDVKIFKRTGPSLHFIFKKRRSQREKRDPYKNIKIIRKPENLISPEA